MRKKTNYKFAIVSMLPALVSLSASAQDIKPTTANRDNWIYWTVGAIVVAILFFLIVVLNNTASVLRQESGKIPFRVWWSSVNRRFFTKAVPVERETDILLDHDYDGIKELDNALPPWWKYGFYFTILVAALYLLRFHIWNTGPTPQQEYDQEMKVAAAQIDEYRKKAGDMVDEKTVTMADAVGIAEGDKIFHSNCFACHGAHGEGGVGPNLTDNYWLHGGTINDIFKTIKYGWPDKGMQSWQKTYSPSQIKDLASYVKSLAGTNPPNAKAAQGDLVQETKTDSPVVKKDSTAKQ